MNDAPKESTGTGLAVPQRQANHTLGMFATEANFALAQRGATALAASDLVPEAYRGKAPNCLIAMDIAHSLGLSPLTVMQNLHIIHGKPSWASPFIIGQVNSCGRFSPLRFEITKRGKKKVEVTTWVGEKGHRRPSRAMVEIEDTECYAYANDLASGERVVGPVVSIEMATAEGWVDKAESKWKTIPQLMLSYRAAAFFGRLYAPDVLMGMHTVEEVLDIDPPATVTARATRVQSEGASSLQNALDGAAQKGDGAELAKPAEDGEPIDDKLKRVAAELEAKRKAAAALKDEPAVKLDAAGTLVAEKDPKPEASALSLRAMLKRDNNKPLNEDEAEELRNFELDLTAWQERQPAQPETTE